MVISLDETKEISGHLLFSLSSTWSIYCPICCCLPKCANENHEQTRIICHQDNHMYWCHITRVRCCCLITFDLSPYNVLWCMWPTELVCLTTSKLSILYKNIRHTSFCHFVRLFIFSHIRQPVKPWCVTLSNWDPCEMTRKSTLWDRRWRAPNASREAYS